MSEDLISRDLRHIWHPCMQMKDAENFPPLEIVGAEGSYLHLKDGSRLIDAVSSWWCKSLGHGHPRLRAALLQQAHSFEHVMGSNTSTQVLVELSERLATLCPPLDKIFYAGDGSMAVEIAIKLALHAQQLKGHPNKTRFIALENGYHGESGLALGLTDLGLYRKPYASILPEPFLLRNLPYVTSTGDPLWNSCESVWPALEAQLAPWAETTAALIVEPVLQGAGGMRLYSPDLLIRLRNWTEKHGICLMVDEILTGFWRTGQWLGIDHAGIIPDLICLSKALTGGWLPFSATLIHSEIYDLFYSDYGKGRDFLHSNTYSGNALGAAVALEAMKLYAEPEMRVGVGSLAKKLESAWNQVVVASGGLDSPRFLGGMVAADLKIPENLRHERVGFQIFQAAINRGALLRNLGNTLYWLPPLNSTTEVLDRLAEITAQSIKAVRQKLDF